MDSEEKHEVEHARRHGISETDEGPFYHDSWWEAYKGGVKGKLGGALIGAAVGAIAGVVAIPVLMLAGAGAAIGAVIAGFSAAGMLYAASDFSSIGKVTGAVASGLEVQERRMKDFVSKQIDGLRKDLKLGKSEDAKEPAASSATPGAQDYRTTHCDKEHCPKKKKLIFWNIAALGLAVGAAVGALLGASGLAEHLFKETLHIAISEGATFAASTGSMAIFGASFGINRDMFREVFDKTDLWFKGCFKRHSDPSHTHAKAHTHELQGITSAQKKSAYDFGSADISKETSTQHRDQLAAARAALLNMDHTRATPH